MERKLQISDLSIGDWVMVKGKDVKVESLGKIRDYVELEGSLALFHIKAVQPIPITPEILEKNGISKTYESDEYAVYKGEGFNVTEYYTELWEFEKHRNRMKIRNVHQLQHALRLAGIEKEIEL